MSTSQAECAQLIRAAKKDGTFFVDDIKGTGFRNYTCPWCGKEKKPGHREAYANAVRVSGYCGKEQEDVEVYVCPKPCYEEIVSDAKEEPFSRALRAKTPAERVAKYCDEHQRMRGLHPNEICGMHIGDEREAVLTVRDLRAVLADRAELFALLVRAPDWSTNHETFSAWRSEVRDALAKARGK